MELRVEFETVRIEILKVAVFINKSVRPALLPQMPPH
jgi:hypothetical protein